MDGPTLPSAEAHPAPGAAAQTVRGGSWRAKRAQTNEAEKRAADRRKDLVALVALLGAGGLLAVRRLPSLLFERASYSDGAAVYQDLGLVRHAVWGAPERLGAGVNTEAREGRPALASDGRWLVFAVGEPGLSADLWMAPIEAGEPGEASPLSGLNTSADELAPAFGDGGLYFASDRAGGAGGYDVWFAPFDDGLAGEPVALDEGVNTPADELDPAAVTMPSGARVLAFASNRALDGRGDFDLYWIGLDAEPEARAAERFEALATAADEREPAFSGSGRTLYLASNRGEDGAFAIYRTLMEDGAWLPPRRVEGLDASSARGPAPSADGFTLYFEAAPSPFHEASDRDLFRARSIELLRRPPQDLGWADLVLVALLLTTAALAWMAKWWDSLDVIYKCFAASIVVHLICMWVSAYIDSTSTRAEPGGGSDAFGGGDPSFELTLRVQGGSSEGWGERGGKLDGSGRSETFSAGGPERLGLTLAHSGPTTAPAAPFGRAEGVLGDAPAPCPSGSELGRQVAAIPGGALELAEPSEDFARFDSSAPAVELVASGGGGGGPAERSSGTGGAAVGLDLDALSAATPGRSAAPGAAGVAGPRDTGAGGPGFAVAGVERGAIGAGASGSVVDLAGPTESFERLAGAGGGSGGAAELELAPATAFTAGSAGGSGGNGSGGDGSAGPSAWSGGAGVGSTAALRAAPGPASGLGRAGSDLPATDSGGSGSAGAPGGAGALRSNSGSALAGGPALSLPNERFEPAGGTGAGSGGSGSGSGAGNGQGSGSGTSELGLPTAAAFAPQPSGLGSGGGSGGGSGPARWKSAAAQPGPGLGADDMPALAIEARPREEDRRLPEPPRRLDDTPYRTRFGPEREVALAEHGGGADTELAVARGLAYLASAQNPGGSWGDPHHRDEKYRQVSIGKTGLCLLAFLGAGHTSHSGEHTGVTGKAIEFLLDSQKDDSGHFGEGCSYGHGIATYALAECYALTRDERLRAPLERAVQHILANQFEAGDERREGGWSYYYHDGAIFDRWPRASITSWQVMALESARLGGIEVPDASFESARRFLLRSWDPRLGAFRYSHDPERLGSGYPTLPGSTPAALFALGLLGEDVGSTPFDDARRYLLDRAPSGFRYRGDDAFVMRAVGNVYFWYYGSLALFRLGGEEWERWNLALKETLLPSQEEDGSWPTLDVYARYAGDGEVDRSYTTAMCVLSLEVYYRYFTPLLQVK